MGDRAAGPGADDALARCVSCNDPYPEGSATCGHPFHRECWGECLREGVPCRVCAGVEYMPPEAVETIFAPPEPPDRIERPRRHPLPTIEDERFVRGLGAEPLVGVDAARSQNGRRPRAHYRRAHPGECTADTERFELQLWRTVRDIYRDPGTTSGREQLPLNPELPSLVPPIMAGMAADAATASDGRSLAAFLGDVLSLPAPTGKWALERLEASQTVLGQPGWRRVAMREPARLFAYLSTAIWNESGRRRRDVVKGERQWDRVRRARVPAALDDVEQLSDEFVTDVCDRLTPRKREPALPVVIANAGELRGRRLPPVQERFLALLVVGTRPADVERDLGCGSSPYRALIGRARRLQRRASR